MAKRQSVTVLGLLALSLVSLGCRSSRLHDEYEVLAYNDVSATLEDSAGTVLEVECDGSITEGTDPSDPGYSTSPDKPGTWEGVVGTDRWMAGCRPLPIGWTVKMTRKKYPANYLECDTAQETGTDTYFSYSYWKILSQRRSR